jgi:starch-binding outer membrane protein, SusD/RagB family
MKRIMNKFIYTACVAGALTMGSCTTSDLDPSLNQEKLAEEAIVTVEDMQTILFGAYNRLTQSGYYGRDFLVTSEVQTANTYSNGNSGRFTTQALFRQQPTGSFFWDEAYEVIASANLVIGIDINELEGPAGTEPDLDLAAHIQGQAYALRALAHFDLLRFFGQENTGGTLGVPYVTEFLGEDQLPGRPTIDENYTAIYADLETAFDLMKDDFYDSSKETMSKYTAPALESRVALYAGDWERAKNAANMVIESNLYGIVPADNFVQSFAQDGSVNSIFELAVSGTDNQGSNGLEFIYRGSTYGDISVTPDAFNMYESDDDVRTDILGKETIRVGEQLRNMGKFPDREANIPVIRYEEVVLNYGEALLELGEGDPLMWLNMIPENRNANTYDAATKENFLEERREEFLFEGLYYWDILRTGNDVVRTGNQEINIPYGDFRLAYPIPFAELDANSNIQQNPGYAGN